ncbi:P-loop containing nucleoside triphosphate hydrolase protein, partial [Rozella allomycis CSF55]
MSSRPTTPKTSGNNNIRVICRFRPENKVEKENNGKVFVDILDHMSVKVQSNEYSGVFSFDRIFDWSTKQDDLFHYSCEEIVNDIMNGYNGTIFAYGQTGSGKTWTMMGSGPDNSENRGLIPRMVEKIFCMISDSPETIEFAVKVSYMEIYMERVRDLLNTINENLPIHEDKSRGVYVKDLSEVYVSSLNEVFAVMKQGTDARMIASTNMNQESSRSHSIFVMTIEQKDLSDMSVKSGSLFLVDLAGSEK